MANRGVKLTVLMLIGKTGNGKSSTANSILRDRLFLSIPNAPPEAKIIKQGVVEFDNRIIKVIDTPRFEDSQFHDTNILHLVTNEIEKVLIVCPEGIHACLIVLRYGSTFTAEERKTIRHVQKNFGEEFQKKYCIILVTNGDRFVHDNGNNLTIAQWAEKQTGEFKDLYVACEKKIILFDNNKKDAERDLQIRQLLKAVDSLGGRMYTDKNFEKAKKTREEMVVNSKRPIIRDEVMAEVSVIFQELKAVYKLETNDVNGGKLNELKARAEELRKKIVKEDKGTGVLNDLIEHVKSLEKNIYEEMNFRERMKLELIKNKPNVGHSSGSAEERDRLISLVETQHKDMMALQQLLLKRDLDNKCRVM